MNRAGKRIAKGPSLLACALASASIVAAALPASAQQLPGPEKAQQAAQRRTVAFPGAQGWARHTPGGRGGKIVRVTTLSATGPGSLAEALSLSGPRIVVFEVGGVIDLAVQPLVIREPFVTVAGQTAPSPGITLIRGGVVVATHDVVIQHIRVRPGEAGAAKRSGLDIDALTTTAGARDVIIDHCSFSWATDENLSASGPRFNGDTPDAWRRATSHRITFSNNIIAEGLAHATHAKGEHSKGTLIHDNATQVLIIGNLYAHNAERNPLFKGGAHGAVINNLIYNPGPRAVHYNLLPAEWGEQRPQNGRLTLIGNVLRAGPSTPADLAFFMLGGTGDVELYAVDNLAVDRIGSPMPATGRYTTSRAEIVPLEAPDLPDGIKPLPADMVEETVLRDAGATPWDRDAVDQRIVSDTVEGRGAIIDGEQDVGGYPAPSPTRRPFDPGRWNLELMIPQG